MGKIHCLKLSSALEHLPRFMDRVRQAARVLGVDPERTGHMELAAEEAFVNICKHGGPPGSVEIELSCLGGTDSLAVEIADTGRPFDPLSRPEPDLKADIEHRAIGGLGVHLIKKLSDAVEYRRKDGRNILRLTFRKERRQ